jgi:DNA-binding helix-hairpin-helix protein with protein kinase domain
MTSVQAVFPTVGGTVRMARAGTTIRLEARVAEGGQGVVYRGVAPGDTRVAVKWYRPGPYTDRQRAVIEGLTLHRRPHDAFAWPIDLVTCDHASGFGYVMPWVPERFGSLVELLRAPEQPPFRVIVAIARQLVDAFAALHASGLCYRDINFGNLLVDGQGPEVIIVDNDNVGIEGGDVFVRGTLRFMAPEVICGQAEPSTVSDLHSLAVFLFFLLMHGHPLEGRRVRVSYTWHSDGHVSETTLAMRHFGLDPHFVFDPADDSNLPEPGDPMLIWWPIYPKFIQDLFVRAFTTGLKDASLSGRITEGEWRLALTRLSDCVSVCSCTAAVFRDPGNPGLRCWNCGGAPPPPALLAVAGRTLALSEGAILTSNHLSTGSDYLTPIGLVERNPRQPQQMVLRNLGNAPWTVQPRGEDVKSVQPGQRLGVRPMTIRFGNVRGSIELPGAAAAAGERGEVP